MVNEATINIIPCNTPTYGVRAVKKDANYLLEKRRVIAWRVLGRPSEDGGYTTSLHPIFDIDHDETMSEEGFIISGNDGKPPFKKLWSEGEREPDLETLTDAAVDWYGHPPIEGREKKAQSQSTAPATTPQRTDHRGGLTLVD